MAAPEVALHGEPLHRLTAVPLPFQGRLGYKHIKKPTLQLQARATSKLRRTVLTWLPPENYCHRANVGIAPYVLKRVFCKTENIGKRFHQKPSTWAAFVVAKFFSKSEIF
ncbi:hypothetical protein [Ruminococcus callidus]|uniref:hypothetical protein n=1 Tax=Ruminococcus callidus TaxID=40519 RepID=UPI0035206A7C